MKEKRCSRTSSSPWAYATDAEKQSVDRHTVKLKKKKKPEKGWN
jgi:hypothetical protein